MRNKKSVIQTTEKKDIMKYILFTLAFSTLCDASQGKEKKPFFLTPLQIPKKFLPDVPHSSTRYRVETPTPKKEDCSKCEDTTSLAEIKITLETERIMPPTERTAKSTLITQQTSKACNSAQNCNASRFFCAIDWTSKKLALLGEQPSKAQTLCLPPIHKNSHSKK